MMTHAYKPDPAEHMCARLRIAWVVQPFSLTFSAVMVPVGLLALCMGDRVSRAFAEIGEGVVSRFLGLLFVIGGTLAIAGILRRCSIFEALGLAILSAGCLLYGTGVVLGLGMSGMVAGPGFLAVAVAMSRRVQTLLALARYNSEAAVEL